MALEKNEYYERLEIALDPAGGVRGAQFNFVCEVIEEGKVISSTVTAHGLAISEESGMFARLTDVVGDMAARLLVERENLANAKAFLETEIETAKAELRDARAAFDKLKAGSDALAQAHAAALAEIEGLRKATEVLPA